MGPWGLCLFNAGGSTWVDFLKKAQISEDANDLGEGLKVRRLSGATGADVDARSQHSRGCRSAPLGAVECGWWNETQRDISLSSLLSHLETATEKRSFSFLKQRLEHVGFCQVLAFLNPVEFILLYLILFLLKWSDGGIFHL